MASEITMNETTSINKVIYEYCILRYVADIEREEFINVGLLMMCKRHRWLHAEIFINETRINDCFKCADMGLLKNQLSVFIRKDVPEKDLPVEERYRWLAAVKSAIIQTSSSHPGILLIDNNASSEEIKSALNNKFLDLFNNLVL